MAPWSGAGRARRNRGRQGSRCAARTAAEDASSNLPQRVTRKWLPPGPAAASSQPVPSLQRPDTAPQVPLLPLHDGNPARSAAEDGSGCVRRRARRLPAPLHPPAPGPRSWVNSAAAPLTVVKVRSIWYSLSRSGTQTSLCPRRGFVEKPRCESCRAPLRASWRIWRSTRVMPQSS